MFNPSYLLRNRIPCKVVHAALRRTPTRWRGDQSVRFPVGRPGVYSPCRVMPKDFKKWYPKLPCLALAISGMLWRTSLQVRLLCLWGRHLMGYFHLYVEDRWPTHLEIGNSQESADIPAKRQRHNSLSRERRSMGKK